MTKRRTSPTSSIHKLKNKARKARQCCSRLFFDYYRKCNKSRWMSITFRVRVSWNRYRAYTRVCIKHETIQTARELPRNWRRRGPMCSLWAPRCRPLTRPNHGKRPWSVVHEARPLSRPFHKREGRLPLPRKGLLLVLGMIYRLTENYQAIIRKRFSLHNCTRMHCWFWNLWRSIPSSPWRSVAFFVDTSRRNTFFKIYLNLLFCLLNVTDIDK